MEVDERGRHEPPVRTSASAPRVVPVPARTLAAVLPLCLALACGGSEEQATPEESLEQAAQQVSDARQEASEAREDARSARERLQERQQALQEARERLGRAQAEVDQAEGALRETEQQLASRASDTAIFRTLQKELLEADALEASAVTVSVEDRVVTLGGSVSDASAREHALEMARSSPGVSRVEDRMHVRETGDDS